MGSTYTFEAIEPVYLVKGFFDLPFNTVRFVEGDVVQTALSEIVFDQREHIFDGHVVW